MNCKLNTIPEERHRIFFNGDCVGSVNYLELLDLRVQIRTTQEEGYAIEFEGEKIEINKYGSLIKWPNGLFDQQDYFLRKLLTSVTELSSQRKATMPELKTSEDWGKEVKDFCKVFDPDGWDRSNFNYSWREEKITKQEFYRRIGMSTCQCDFKRLAEWAKS